MRGRIKAKDLWPAQYIVAHSLLVSMVLLSLGPSATLTAMLSYKMRKVTIIPPPSKGFGYTCRSYLCWRR